MMCLFVQIVYWESGQEKTHPVQNVLVGIKRLNGRERNFKKCPLGLRTALAALQRDWITSTYVATRAVHVAAKRLLNGKLMLVLNASCELERSGCE